MIPEETIQRILDQLSMVDLVSSYITLEQKGGRFWGCCPFHNEKTPSFSVTEDKKLYYCFGCHKGGSLFNFIMEMEGLPFIEAVKFAAAKAGITIEESANPAQDQTYRNKQALAELYKKVAGSFEYILYESSEGAKARAYLSSRGFEDAALKRFDIGYAPTDRKWLYSFLLSKGYSAEFLAISGLFSAKNPGFPLYSGRIIIPIKSPRGEIIAFGGRLLEGDGPKYINSPDTILYSKRHNLFAIYESAQNIRQQGIFHICEGYFDALALHQSGVNTAVAPLGTALTPEQMRLLKRYAGKGILVFDADEAGFNATRKTSILGEQLGVSLSIVPVTSGKDPAEIMQKEGSGALINILKYPINSFDYLLDTYSSKMGKFTPEKKEQLVKLLMPYINAVDSSIRKEEYKKTLGEILDISVTAVAEDLNRGTKSPASHQNPAKQVETHSDKGLWYSAEVFLLTAVISKPALFSEVRRVIALEDIGNQLARKIYIALEECYRREVLSIDNILELIDDESARKMIVQRIASGEFSLDTDTLVKDTILKVRTEILKTRRLKVEKRLTGNVDNESMRELLGEKMYLDGELDKLRLRRNDRSAQ